MPKFTIYRKPCISFSLGLWRLVGKLDLHVRGFHQLELSFIGNQDAISLRLKSKKRKRILSDWLKRNEAVVSSRKMVPKVFRSSLKLIRIRYAIFKGHK